MDEVDGLAGTDDRGGVSALLRVSKLSRWPIVTTANDPYGTKLRTLRMRSKFLKLNIPSQREITSILENILNNEKISVNQAIVKSIVSSCHGDIRAAINDLMNLSQGREFVDKKALIVLKERDSETVIFDALKKIFGGATSPIQANEVTRDLDVDYQDFINFVHENALHYAITTRELVDIYDHISKADIYKGRIMREQQWGLLKYFYFHLSAGVRDAKKHPVGFGKPLQRYSAFFENWAQRQKRNDIAYKIGHHTHSSISKTITGTLPYLELIFGSIKKPRGKKELTRSENPSLNSIAKITYANEFTSGDLEYFYKKSSSTIPWILEGVEDLESELVKKHIQTDRIQHSKLTKIIDDNKKIEKEATKVYSVHNSLEKSPVEEIEKVPDKKKKKKPSKPKSQTEIKKKSELNNKNNSTISDLDMNEVNKDTVKIEKEEKKKTKNLMDFLE